MNSYSKSSESEASLALSEKENKAQKALVKIEGELQGALWHGLKVQYRPSQEEEPTVNVQVKIQQNLSEDGYIFEDEQKQYQKKWAQIKIRKYPNFWTYKEDKLLKVLVQKYGNEWTNIAQKIKSKNRVQCMQRWKNQLKPGIKKGKWTKAQDSIILRAQNTQNLANKWAQISKLLKGRVPGDIRLRWKQNLSKSEEE